VAPDEEAMNSLLAIAKNMTAVGALLGSAAVSIYFGWKVFAQHLGMGQGGNAGGRFTSALEHVRVELSGDIAQLQNKLADDQRLQTTEFKNEMRDLEHRVSFRISELVNRLNNIDSRIDSVLRREPR
jgi:hypothetical protein